MRIGLALGAVAVSADPDQCTSIAVGPKATVEGSSFATHTNDCIQCDPRVLRIDAQDYPEGAMRPIAPFKNAYPRFVNGRAPGYDAKEGETPTEPIGEIPQVKHTYAYWEASYPLINEHGLGFGESTCGAKLVGKSVMEGGTAIMNMAELMRIALERCKDAVCAIKLMGEMGVKYGFYGEDPGMPGAGETVTVADKTSAWVFHISGGPNGSSAVYVAQRVPDDHVAVIANNFIIQKVRCQDDDFICSDNIFSVAREENLCKFETEAEFNWLACYAPDVRTFSYMPGFDPIPMYATLRLWRVQNFANPNLGITVTDNPFEYAFSVPVAKKVSRENVMDWMRDHYEGTLYDMTQGILAGPFNNPNRIEKGPGMKEVHGQFARAISIPRTNYGLLIEATSVPEKSIAWLATDVPASSVFVPFFAVAEKCAEPYTLGSTAKFTRDSAWWAFGFVANWMNIMYKPMADTHVTPAVHQEQTKILNAVAALEKDWPTKEKLEEVQTKLQDDLVKAWWKLGEFLIMAYNDGYYNLPEPGQPIGYPAWWLQMIGFNSESYKPQFVEWSASPPALLMDTILGKAALATNAVSMTHQQAGFVPGILLGLVCGVLLVAVGVQRKQPAGFEYIRAEL